MPILHFSIDDCMEMFRDITQNNYDSLFQSKYFYFLRELNKAYGAKISLFAFYKHAGFCLNKVSDRYKSEWEENSTWLQIGFHGYNEQSRYINERENIVSDYKKFAKQIERIAGRNSIANVIRLHCFSGSKSSLEALGQFGIVGFLSDDSVCEQNLRTSYYLDRNESLFINSHGMYKDIDNGICFFKTFTRLENLKDTYNQANMQEKDLILFTHECCMLDAKIQELLHTIYTQCKDTHTSAFPSKDVLQDFHTDSIKRFFDTHIPITSCNLRCQYCYITQQNLWFNKPPKFNYDANHIAQCLSRERLGGTCLFNMCGGGETLLHPYIIELIQSILVQGHYIWIVTNGTLGSRFQKIANLPKNLLHRLAFKFSFHYLELKRTNKLMKFVENVSLMRESGCSYTIEITPHDELTEYIDEIKDFSIKHFGALPHITVARDETNNKKILSAHQEKEKYAKLWESFESNLFDFKLKIFLEKRNEYCMAGKWTYNLHIGNGNLAQCYSNGKSRNIFDDPNVSLELPSVGYGCKEPHCYNGHAFLTLGAIPSLSTPTYSSMRNRVQANGREWLNPYMKKFISHKLSERNQEDNLCQKAVGAIKAIRLKIRKKNRG